MSDRNTSRNLARRLLVAAVMTPLLLAACGKKDAGSSMPSGPAAKPASPPMSAPAPTPPATSAPTAGGSTSTAPGAPATGSEPAK